MESEIKQILRNAIPTNDNQRMACLEKKFSVEIDNINTVNINLDEDRPVSTRKRDIVALSFSQYEQITRYIEKHCAKKPRLARAVEWFQKEMWGRTMPYYHMAHEDLKILYLLVQSHTKKSL
jgi:hypothetical protein